jgi:hypothetical protein
MSAISMHSGTPAISIATTCAICGATYQGPPISSCQMCGNSLVHTVKCAIMECRECKRMRAWMRMIGEHIKEQPGCFGISQLLIEEGNAQRSGTSPACTPPASGRA